MKTNWMGTVVILACAAAWVLWISYSAGKVAGAREARDLARVPDRAEIHESVRELTRVQIAVKESELQALQHSLGTSPSPSR